MKKNLKTIFALGLVPASLLAFSSGPPDGLTGAPDEGTCVQCHSNFPLNSGDGNFALFGPESWTPGETYEITVDIEDNEQSRWGFEITQMGFGNFTITDSDFTQLSSSNDREYVKHTSAGTQNGTANGPVSWSFDWTAPTGDDLPEEITFYAAGNAANGASGNQGDYIYTGSMTIPIDNTSVGEPVALPAEISLRNVPNPFNPTTELQVELARSADLRLAVYDIRGTLVTRLHEGRLPAGTSRMTWDGRTANGTPVASGVYIAVAEGEGSRVTHRMLLLK